MLLEIYDVLEKLILLILVIKIYSIQGELEEREGEVRLLAEVLYVLLSMIKGEFIKEVIIEIQGPYFRKNFETTLGFIEVIRIVIIFEVLWNLMRFIVGFWVKYYINSMLLYVKLLLIVKRK